MAHGLRIVTELERRYAAFDGLNLTQPTLAGLVKHNGPLLDASGAPASDTLARRSGLDPSLRSAAALDLSRHASLEAQAAAIADDIAYDAHDIDDGLHAGLFSLRRDPRRRSLRRTLSARSRIFIRGWKSRT